MLRTSPSDGIPPQNRGVEEIDAQSIGKLLGTPGGVAGAARSEEEEMIPAGGQQAWDECHLVIRNMATLSPFWDSEWRLYRHIFFCNRFDP